MFKRTLISFFVFSALFLSSCGNHGFEDFLDCTDWECVLDKIISRTGWLAEDEGLDSIEEGAILDDNTSLPPSFSLESKFPPIGDQGQYGTCVAWATGYNLKTALNAIDKGWSSTELSNKANQTSPKDLWFAIGKSDKGTNCGGTNFEPAMDALISKGADNLSTVPYNNMGNCSGTSSGNANNKLGKYRKIAYNKSLSGSGSGNDGMTLENFKGYLSQGRPILLGARLGDRFMSWNNASVISSDTYNDPGMQHAYHAMVVVGYDDSKSAFRVRNSWGNDWGDKGSIWVDYNFFLKDFCFAAFVAENPSSSSINAKKSTSGYDLQATEAKDFAPDANSPKDRVFSYSVRNSGTKPILANQKWTVLYMYYNAYNANDNGIIYEGDNTESEIRYTMPPITGKYYLVVYADAYNAIEESDEDNNFYFIAADKGRPLEFKDGIMLNQIVPNAKAKSVQELGGKPNAYTPAEIRALVLRNKKK
jgi:C1A family cysteine protease